MEQCFFVLVTPLYKPQREVVDSRQLRLLDYAKQATVHFCTRDDVKQQNRAAENPTAHVSTLSHEKVQIPGKCVSFNIEQPVQWRRRAAL